MKWFLLLIPVLFLASCVKGPRYARPADDSTWYAEPHRPQFHFSPEKNWTNDPNGLVYYEGEYHLFYQYNPYGDKWGHMSWGHAVSKDLLAWEHLPLAIAEYENPAHDSTMIFSGTVVVDKNNTSGLCDGKDCLVAIYTSNVHKDNKGLLQHQSLAYSNDQGRTWTRYEKNPILDIQRKDFRDPKVFWYEPAKQWIMALVIPDLYKVRFYASSNLINWNQTGEFGPLGDTTRIWECPDLYPVQIENQPGKQKWVLSLSGGHPAGPAFVGMQYFVGEFNGNTFVPDDPKQPARYVDYGKDFYAGIVVNNNPGQDPVMIGWVNNWTYANQIPTHPWRGAMSLPRVLSLRQTSGGLRLAQRPIAATYALHQKEIIDFTSPHPKTSHLQIVLYPRASADATIHIVKSDSSETLITYDPVRQVVALDRTHSGLVSFNKDFPSIEKAEVAPINGAVTFDIFIDQSIIEVFVNDGLTVLTEQVFSPAENVTVYTTSETGAEFNRLGWRMKRTWKH